MLGSRTCGQSPSRWVCSRLQRAASPSDDPEESTKSHEGHEKEKKLSVSSCPSWITRGIYESICGEAAISGGVARCGTAIGRVGRAGGLADGGGSSCGYGGGGVAHVWLGTGSGLVVASAAVGA